MKMAVKAVGGRGPTTETPRGGTMEHARVAAAAERGRAPLGRGEHTTQQGQADQRMKLKAHCTIQTLKHHGAWTALRGMPVTDPQGNPQGFALDTILPGKTGSVVVSGVVEFEPSDPPWSIGKGMYKGQSGKTDEQARMDVLRAEN